MKRIIAPLAAAFALAALPAGAQEAPAAPAAPAPAVAAPAAPAATAAQPQKAHRGKGARPIIGRITAKADDSLTVGGGKRGAGETKVAVGQDTRFAHVETGALPDLSEGYLVAVVGQRQGEKLAATGVVRLAKPEGKGKRDELRGTLLLARSAGRLLAGPGKQAAGQKPGAPVVGRIVSTQPLSIQTVGAHKAGGEKIELTTTETTRVLCLMDGKLADLEQGDSVLVVAKAGTEAAPAAQLVVEVPHAGKAGGKRKK